MATAIGNIDRLTLRSSGSPHSTLAFAVRVALRLLSPRIFNSASRAVLINQLYFTSVQVLPLFLFVSLIFGSMVDGIVFQLLKDLGLTEYLGPLLMGFVVTEIAPFVTVLLIALRSSSAIITEVSVMKVNRELQTLDTFNIDLIDYLFVPRVLTGMISVVLLSNLFSLVVIFVGFLVSVVVFGTSFDAYVDILMTSADFQDLTILLIKCATFGFFITLIPIQQGLTASRELTSIPIVVLNGMVKVFMAIVIIEVLSLVIRFI